MSGELVAQDGDTLHLPAMVEVSLQLLSGAPVVHLTQARPWCWGAPAEASTSWGLLYHAFLVERGWLDTNVWMVVESSDSTLAGGGLETEMNMNTPTC